MYIIGIDLAMNSVGIAITGNKTFKYSSLVLSQKEREKFTELQRINRLINWLFDYLNGYIYKTHRLIIEDIFAGVNPWSYKIVAKMMGAVSYKYSSLTGKEPILRMAVTARKLAGISARSQKAEVQLFVIDKFKLGKVNKEVRKEVLKLAPICLERFKKPTGSVSEEKLKELKKEHSKKRNRVKNKLSRLSIQIANETNINEHIADAIVLTLGDKNA